MKKNAFIKVLAVLGIAVLGLTGGHTGGNGFASDAGEKGNGIVAIESGDRVGNGIDDGQERNGLEKDSGDRAGNGLYDGKEGGNGFDSTGGGNG